MTIEAYPLCWPAGWRRTKPDHQRRARFTRNERQLSMTNPGFSYNRKCSLTVADGRSRVLESLRKLGAHDRDVVISTNLMTRNDGLPRSGQREPEYPGVAVYWHDKKNQPKVMAIDQYDRVADNLAAIASTLEAMRAIERHGGGQILDRVFTGFTALPAPGSNGWRSVLGIAEDDDVATLVDVTERYKSLRSRHHPDKGGDAAEFDRIERAYQQATEELS